MEEIRRVLIEAVAAGKKAHVGVNFSARAVVVARA